MPRDLSNALDVYIAAQPEPKPSRPEAIRALLREALTDKGVMNKAALADQIEALEIDIGSIPTEEHASPEAALHTMDRALAENELVKLQSERTASQRKSRPSRAKK